MAAKLDINSSTNLAVFVNGHSAFCLAQSQRQLQLADQERSVSVERLTAAQQTVSELKRHNEQLVERSSAAQRELTQERLSRAQIEVQLKNSQQVRWRGGGGGGKTSCLGRPGIIVLDYATQWQRIAGGRTPTQMPPRPPVKNSGGQKGQNDLFDQKGQNDALDPRNP